MLRSIHGIFHRHYHRRYHGVYNHAKQLFVFDLGLLALALVMLGSSLWFFFWKPGVADKVEVLVSIGEERIRSGDEVKISIDYTNHSKVTLKNATLAFRMPPGFILDESKTANASFSGNLFQLGDLSPGEKGHSEIYGTLWSDLDTFEDVIAIVSFKQENKSFEEQSFGKYILNLPDSVLVGKLAVSSSSFSGMELPFSYTLTNQGKSSVPYEISSNLELLELSGTESGSIQPGDDKILSGKILVPGGENFSLTFLPKAKINNSILNQGKDGKLISIFEPEITLSAELVSASRTADVNMTIPVKLSWKNDGPYTLKNQKIRIQATHGTINLNRTASENDIIRDGFDLIIDKDRRTMLSNGAAGTSDSFEVRFHLPATFASKAESVSNLTITPIFEAEMEGVEGQVFTKKGNSIVLPLTSEVSLSGNARYYTPEGDQLGRGPLPPEVGEITKYWVFINAFNTVNPLRDGKLLVSLAPGVSFTGKQSVSIGRELKYDKQTNSLSWELSNELIPSNSQSGFYFEVAVTPTAEQAGKLIPLVKEIYFTAEDDRVGKKFEVVKANITNKLLESDRGSELGFEVVMP